MILETKDLEIEELKKRNRELEENKYNNLIDYIDMCESKQEIIDKLNDMNNQLMHERENIAIRPQKTVSKAANFGGGAVRFVRF